jgi:CubicO group peptidase (beta-lactamase class C family)
MAHDVFISHSARDKPYADGVCAKLESRGIRCWIAPRNIRPGMSWGSAIVEAIDTARVMLLLFSSHANGSPQVSREVERAVSKGLVVVPVRVEDVQPTGNLEYFLGTPHWLDAITPPFERHLEGIADSVDFWLERIDNDSQPESRGANSAALAATSPSKPSKQNNRDSETPNRFKWFATRWSALGAVLVAVLLGSVLVIRVYPKTRTDPSKGDLSPLLQPLLDQYKAPGMVVALVQGDRVTATGSVGVRKIGTSEPISISDQIHLGSCTKAMTAVLIGMLIDDGPLKWNSTLAEIFPELADRMNPAFRNATVRQLLDDTAGFPANLDWWAIDRTGAPLISQRKMAVEQAVSVAPMHAPGTTFLYTNLGYVVLGAVLEKKTGQAWEDLMRTKIFGPLGMASAGFGPPGTKGLVDAPWGHRITEGRVDPSQSDNPPVLGPAGRVHCSIGEWARFVSTFLQSEQTLLSEKTLRVLVTPNYGSDFAGGWIVTNRDWGSQDLGGGIVMTMTGSNTFWVSVVWVAPRRNFAILFSTNIGNDEFIKMTDDAVGEILKSDQFSKLVSSNTAH